MNKTEHASFQIQIHSGDINENLIVIEESNPSQFDLSSLPLQSKTIKCSKENWAALATNEKHLLMYKKPNLCLVNQDCTVLKKSSMVIWRNLGYVLVIYVRTIYCN